MPMKESILVQTTIQRSGDGNHLPVARRETALLTSTASLEAGTAVMNKRMPSLR
jgi:hypothetical protein